MKIDRFENIESWQLGRELTRRIYAVSGKGDFAKDFELRNQLRRASGSVMHNIAEGFDAGSNLEFIKFLGYSKRSCTEIQSELYVALDQKYLVQSDFESLYEMTRITRSKIGAFIKYLREFEKKRRMAMKAKSSIPKLRTLNPEP